MPMTVDARVNGRNVKLWCQRLIAPTATPECRTGCATRQMNIPSEQPIEGGGVWINFLHETPLVPISTDKRATGAVNWELMKIRYWGRYSRTYQTMMDFGAAFFAAFLGSLFRCSFCWCLLGPPFLAGGLWCQFLACFSVIRSTAC
jgi:hypothetical protein